MPKQIRTNGSLAALATDAQQRLRDLLRQQRRRIEPDDEETLDDYENRLKGLIGLILIVEETLKRLLPLEEDEVGRFGELISHHGFATAGFATGLARMVDDDEGADRRKAQTRSFEEVLHGVAAFLISLEDLLKRVKNPSNKQIAYFKWLIKQLISGMRTFFKVLWGGFKERDWDLIGSYETLIHELHDLLESFEALIKKRSRASAFAEDLEELLEEEARFVWSLEYFIRTNPNKEDNPHPDYLTVSLEDSLKEQQRLLRSFTRVVKLAGSKPTLLKSLESLLKVHIKRVRGYLQILYDSGSSVTDEWLDSMNEVLDKLLGFVALFARLIAGRVPDDREFLKSLEDVLHELGQAITETGRVIRHQAHELQTPDRVRHYEKQLKQYEAELKRFQRVLARLVDDKRLRESFEGLVNDFKEGIKWIHLIKEALDPVPADIKKSDEDLVRSLQQLERRKRWLLARAHPLLPEEIERYVMSLIDTEKILIKLRALLGPRTARRPDSSSPSFRSLVAGQRRLNTQALRLVKRVKESSVFLLDALEDLQHLQNMLEQMQEDA